MNTKIALLLSTALTAFVVTVAYGLVTRLNSNNQAAALAPRAAVSAPMDVPVADSQLAVQSPLAPDQAVSLAVAAINRQDVYSVELVSYQGFQSYKVVFSSGDVVYIGMNSQYLDRTTLPSATTATAQPSISVQASTLQNQSSPSQGAVAVRPGGGEHEVEHEGD